jgi:hypothetical protein
LVVVGPDAEWCHPLAGLNRLAVVRGFNPLRLLPRRQWALVADAATGDVSRSGLP